MAESTLNLTYDDIQSEIGDYLAIGRTVASWSAADLARVASCIRAGLLRFYTAHDWTWLKPRTTLVAWADRAVTTGVTVTVTYSAPTSTITANTAGTFTREMIGASIVITDIGTATIVGYTSGTVVTATGDYTASAKTFSIAAGESRLPDNFGGQDCTMQFASGSTTAVPAAIQMTSVNGIIRMRQQVSQTAPPRFFAIRPITLAEATGQRWEAMWYPEPDADYTLECQYRLLADATTDGAYYVWGGVAHRNTVLAVCKAEAELTMNDQPGPWEARYRECLEQSKSYDAMAVGPKNLGYNGTRHSNNRGRLGRLGGTVTYNGTQY